MAPGNRHRQQLVLTEKEKIINIYESEENVYRNSFYYYSLVETRKSLQVAQCGNKKKYKYDSPNRLNPAQSDGVIGMDFRINGWKFQ